MSGSTIRKNRAGRPALTEEEKRSERIELRVTLAEKRELELLCEQGNVTMTTLLLTGTLEGIASLPHFQRLPTDVMQQLTALHQMAGRLFGYAYTLETEERTQQQVRELVFELGQLGETIRYQISRTALPAQLIGQLTQLRDGLSTQQTKQTSAEVQRQLLVLINEVLNAYKPDKSV